MKQYGFPALMAGLQMMIFYGVPVVLLSCSPGGMVLLMLLMTFGVSFAVGAVAAAPVKFVYPIVISALFVPSVLLFYNDSALVHAVWYLIISSVGILAGTGLRTAIRKKEKI